jgi:hypothetical protein
MKKSNRLANRGTFRYGQRKVFFFIQDFSLINYQKIGEEICGNPHFGQLFLNFIKKRHFISPIF